MKNLINILVTSVTVGVGYCFGMWLWEEKLQNKVEDFGDYLASKKS